jgi:hypothetical protein
MVFRSYGGVTSDAVCEGGVINYHCLPTVEGVADGAHPGVMVGRYRFGVTGEAVAGRGMHEGNVLPTGRSMALPALSYEMLSGTGVNMAR